MNKKKNSNTIWVNWLNIDPIKNKKDYLDRQYIIYDFLVVREYKTLIEYTSSANARVEIVYDTGRGETKDGLERQIIEGEEYLVLNHVLDNCYLDETEKKIFLIRWKDAKYKSLYKSSKNLEYLPLDVIAGPNELLKEALNKHNRSAKDVSPEDYSSLYKVLKGERELSRDKAVEVAKELGMDPVDLLFDKIKIPVWGIATGNPTIATEEFTPHYKYDCRIYENDKEEFVICPRDIYNPLIKAIRIHDPESIYNGYIAFYNLSNKISESANNKICVVGTTEELNWIDDDCFVPRYQLGLYQIHGREKKLFNIDPLANNDEKLINSNFHPTFVSEIIALVDPKELDKPILSSEKTKLMQKIGAAIRQHEMSTSKVKTLDETQLNEWRKRYKKKKIPVDKQMNQYLSEVQKSKEAEDKIRKALDQVFGSGAVTTQEQLSRNDYKGKRPDFVIKDLDKKIELEIKKIDELKPIVRKDIA